MQHHPLARLLSYAHRHRRRVLLATVYSVLNKVLDLAPPVLIGVAVDVVVEREDSLLAQWGIVSVSDQLLWLAGATIVVWFLESVFEYAWQWTWRTLAQSVQHELRIDTFDHVQNLDMQWFQDQSLGQTLSVLNDDVNQLERFLNGGANDLIQVATTAVVIGAVFFWASPSLALLAILPVPIVLWGSFRFQSRIAPHYADVRERAARVNGHLATALAGIETIKCFTAEQREVRRLTALSDDYRRANGRAILLSSAFSPLIRMAIVIGFTATLVQGGWLVLDGHLEVGTYSMLVYLTQRLLWPLTRVGETFDLYQRAMASTNRVLDLIDTPVHITDGAMTLPRQAIQGDVRFRDVTFGYPGRAPLFQKFNVHIPAGQTVAIVGPTGSGKTSLIRLLARFYEPTDGSIELDGHDVRNLSLASLRGAVGLVSQSVFLFAGTIRENLNYGMSELQEEAVMASAVTAEAHGFVSDLPDGYDTRIGDRGQTLSGGQAQRISIARALVHNPPILILDEATSAVDNETEAAIQRSLSRIATGRTTVVIAHRLSTIRHAERIIVLQQGQIVEDGTHDALLTQQGIYARLWAVQTGQPIRA